MTTLPYIPIPHITSNLRTAKKWYCNSDEYCTWDGSIHVSCCGHGDTMQEAYEDWLESYEMFRYDNGEEE